MYKAELTFPHIHNVHVWNRTRKWLRNIEIFSFYERIFPSDSPAMGLPLSRLGLHSQIPLILHRLFLDPLLRVSKFFYHLRSGIAVGVGGMPPPLRAYRDGWRQSAARSRLQFRVVCVRTLRRCWRGCPVDLPLTHKTTHVINVQIIRKLTKNVCKRFLRK